MYLRDGLSGAYVPVGVYDHSLPGPCNRMRPLYEGFLTLGVPALRRCAQSDSEWVTVDEIGYLEVGCDQYLNALLALFDAKRVACAVRKQALPFLQALQTRDDVLTVDLDDPYGDIGCVVMASGLSKRFGQNKLLADFGGRPVIERVLDATEGIFAKRAVITRSREVAALCEARCVSAVLHELPYRSDTVRLGLQAVEGVGRCMFCAADQPLLRRETVAALVLASADAPNAVWRPACVGVPGTPVTFPQWAFEALSRLPEGKGGGAVIAQYPDRVRTLEIQDARELRDVDTPADLDELLQYI